MRYQDLHPFVKKRIPVFLAFLVFLLAAYGVGAIFRDSTGRAINCPQQQQINQKP